MPALGLRQVKVRVGGPSPDESPRMPPFPEALIRRPVPSSADAQAKKAGYRSEVAIDLSGELAAELCLDAGAEGLKGVSYYATPENPPYHHIVPGAVERLFARKTVVGKLLSANRRLAACGLELYLFDAWRPRAVQVYFHDVWFPAWLQQRRPDLKGEALTKEVELYWSAPTVDEASPAPHATGSAVDLTLVYRSTGQPLFMGGLFDDVTESAWTDWFERAPIVSMSDAEAQKNRRLLYWAMTGEGFANNPTEWWHYSWGDQMWARLTGAPSAHYGACDPATTP